MMKAKKKQKKVHKNDDETIFEKGDLVGAKIKGHPLWPGRIEAVHDSKGKRKYTVRFFGSNDTSQSFMQIKSFEDFTQQERACSRKGFKEALLLCQEEHAALSSDEKGAAICKAKGANVVEEEDEDEEEDEAAEISDYQSASSSPALKINTDIKQEKVNSTETSEDAPSSRSRLDSGSDQATCDGAKNSSKQSNATKTKTDGENVKKHSETLRKLTLAKLEEKVKKKIEEKEALKMEVRERRSLKYISPKLVLINQKLKHISSLASRFSRASKFGKTDLQKWNSAVRIYQTLSPILTRCVNFFNRNNMKLSLECRDCHETLVSIIKDVKRAQNDNGVPVSTKKELKRITKLMKNSDLIDFINDDMKNAMTERKENDAE